MNEKIANTLIEMEIYLPQDKYEEYKKGMKAFENGELLVGSMYQTLDEGVIVNTPSRFFVAGFIDAMAEALR